MTCLNTYARIEQISAQVSGVQTGAHRHASVGNGFEPASSELRDSDVSYCEPASRAHINLDGLQVQRLSF